MPVSLPLDVKVPCEFAVVHSWKNINEITKKYFISRQLASNIWKSQIYIIQDKLSNIYENCKSNNYQLMINLTHLWIVTIY